MLETIDLGFLGYPSAIGVYLVETPDGPALLDCGPSSTLPRLREGLRERGLELTDVHDLLLSHIHLDHAGAAGSIVREHPQLTVWVSEVGAPHLAEPSRLEASARRLYGESFDTLWGELAPVPNENIRIASGDVLGWESFPTPGHASHHVCYLRDGTLFAGDACGVRVQPSEYVLPVAPPPDIDVEAWHASIDEIERRDPDRLAPTHFGVATDVAQHLRSAPLGARPLGRARRRRGRPRAVRRGGAAGRRPGGDTVRRDRSVRPVLAGAAPLLVEARGGYWGSSAMTLDSVWPCLSFTATVIV